MVICLILVMITISLMILCTCVILAEKWSTEQRCKALMKYYEYQDAKNKEFLARVTTKAEQLKKLK